MPGAHRECDRGDYPEEGIDRAGTPAFSRLKSFDHHDGSESSTPFSLAALSRLKAGVPTRGVRPIRAKPGISHPAQNADRPERWLSAGLRHSTATTGANGAEFNNDPGFAVRVKARSGASACPYSRCLVWLACLAGKSCFLGYATWRFEAESRRRAMAAGGQNSKRRSAVLTKERNARERR